jgi:eukaryotic-like serine/threonine-protein kinase
MVGQEISQFILVQRLGSGGMGEVYLAVDKLLDRNVAIKVLSQSYAANGKANRHLLREARAAAGLDHPNICTIHEVGESGGHGYIAMQYVDGETLASIIERGPLDYDQALSVACQLAEALAAAHSVGIIHRDIKPHNLMLTPKGQLKVLDFGLATRLASADWTESNGARNGSYGRGQNEADGGGIDPDKTLSLTSDSGAMAGTVPYMSPEQWRGETLDGRTDIFSFGSVLYEILTGKRLFGRETVTQTITAILTEAAPRLNLVGSAHNQLDEVQAVLDKCLAKERAHRYESAAELATALHGIQSRRAGSEGVTDYRTPRSYSRLAKVVAPIFSLLLVLGIVARYSGIGSTSLPTSAAATKPPVASIAVMPLKTSTLDTNDNYLGDGLTVSLINQLSQIPTLKVIARNSVFQYKGQEIDPKTIGQQLDVNAVLRGSIEEQGDAIEVSLELSDTSQNNTLWSRRFTSKRQDVLELQSNILREVTEKLRPQSADDIESRFQKRITQNRLAYDLYLQGIFNLNKRTPGGTRIAVDSFQQAINLDSNFALAFAGLADAYSLLDDFDLEAPKISMPKAEEAARAALAIDPSLGEAHSTLGLLHRDFSLNWPDAERELKRALELNPNYAVTYNRYGWFLISVKRFDEALMYMRRAQELDPRSLNINTAVGLPYYYARRFDKAIEEYQRTLQLDPNFYPANLYLGLAYIEVGREKEAIKIFQRLRKVDEEGTDTAVCLAYAYVKAGQKNRARSILNSLHKLAARKHVGLSDLALVHAQLEEPDEAIDLLEEAYAERELTSLILVEPMLDPLRGNPRFEAILKRLKLTQ